MHANTAAMYTVGVTMQEFDQADAARDDIQAGAQQDHSHAQDIRGYEANTAMDKAESTNGVSTFTVSHTCEGAVS